MTNKDQIKGAVKQGVGRAQETMGKLVDSNEQRAKGVAKQIKGKAQQALGNAREAVKDSPTRK